MPASAGNIRSVIEIVVASADPGAGTVSHLDCAGHSAALPSDRSAAIAEVPNPALAKEQMRAAIVRRSRKKASTQYHRPNAVGKAPRAIVDHFAPKGASEVSLGKADGRWPGARIRAAGQIAPPSWPGRAPGARGVEPERDQNKGDAPEWRFILSISAIYFEIINCFNLIHLLISIPPSTKAVMKRQLMFVFCWCE